MNPLVLWVLILAGLALIFFAVRYFTRTEVEVRVAPVSYQPLSKTVSTNGKVEPVEEFPAHAPFPGVIQNIYVSVGQHVQKGTLLVRMDDADAKARLATSRANLSSSENVQRDLQRGGNVEDRNRFAADIASSTFDEQQAEAKLATEQKLLAHGSASAAEVAQAQQDLDARKLALRNAKQRQTERYSKFDVANAGAHVSDASAALNAAQNNLNNIDIRSPISGTVYNIPVSQYDNVPAGDDILDVADLSRLQVRAFFDEPEIGNLKRGQPVTILWEAKRGYVWHGHVELAPTTVQSYGTRNVGVCIITVDDPTPELIPNTNVTITVTELKLPHVLTVPREALHAEGPRNFVYTIANGRLIETPVTVGISNTSSAEITGGLKENDRVVLAPKSSLIELSAGLAVKQVP